VKKIAAAAPERRCTSSGEAWSTNQGWVEGALETAEAVVSTLTRIPATEVLLVIAAMPQVSNWPTRKNFASAPSGVQQARLHVESPPRTAARTKVALRREERFSVSFVCQINPLKRSAPMRRDQRTQRMPASAPMVKAATDLPSSGFVLIVDGQAKAEFKTQDQALKAATDLKRRFPVLQVKIYDAENRRSEAIELAAA
jgi:hypothetical protein